MTSSIAGRFERYFAAVPILLAIGVALLLGSIYYANAPMDAVERAEIERSMAADIVELADVTGAPVTAAWSALRCQADSACISAEAVSRERMQPLWDAADADLRFACAGSIVRAEQPATHLARCLETGVPVNPDTRHLHR